MKKICIVTGTRAEWGLLSNLAAMVRDSTEMQLQIIATNMHLSPEFGLTYREIEADGFVIDKKVEMLVSGDTKVSTLKSCGLEIIGFADALRDLAPDIMVILGDRHEMLAAAFSALIFGIPIAHIAGGDISEGAYDDAIRHAITKMSRLHFVATEDARRRVIQMGESPDSVFWVGATGAENMKTCPLLDRESLETSLGFELTDKCFLVTYHPATLDDENPADQCDNLLAALDEFPEYRVLLTCPNSDPGNREITTRLEKFAAERAGRCRLFPSLGKTRYLSALRFVTAVIGNSSSGLIEVPSFGIPTLDIGIRQRGRTAGPGVLHCGVAKNSIAEGIRKILTPDFRSVAARRENPYDKPGTTQTIHDILQAADLRQLQIKRFCSVDF